MFRGIEKKSFYTLERIWYSENEKSPADIIRYTRTKNPMTGLFVHCTSEETVISDLNQSNEEILSHSTKTVKYEVNKCRKEDISISFYTSEELKNNKIIINEFESAYLDFAKEINNKDIEKAYQRSKINNYIECNCIMLSKAVKDDVSVYHVYSCGGGECCLNYSVSNFRIDPTKRNLAGRMNRYLHIEDMDWFRNHGISLYDWGNISSSSNPNGIDKFKMSFGGQVVTVYQNFVGNTLLGKMLVGLYKITH